MPAKSKSQQRLFGMVHAYQTGRLKDPPEIVKEIADEISEEDAEHFARTKHKGLKEKKSEYAGLLKKAWRAIESFREGDRIFAPGPTRIYHCKLEGDDVKSEEKGNAGYEQVNMNLSAKTASAEYRDAIMALKEKIASGQHVVVLEGRQKYEFDTIEDASRFITAKGSIPQSEVKQMLSDRAGLINGMQIVYTDSVSDATKADSDSAIGSSALKTLSDQAGAPVNEGLVDKVRGILSSLS